MKRIALLLAVVVAVPANAQQPASEQEIARIIAYAHAYREKLPSLECDELIRSQRLSYDEVRWEVRIEATLRELRDDTAPDVLRDSRVYKTVDGKPPKKHIAVPYFVSNAFSNGLGMAGQPMPACYDYRLRWLNNNTVELKVELKPDATDPSCAGEPEEYHKTLLIDAATGAVKHVKRDISPRWANQHKIVPDLSIDFAPVKLGSQTFWLPVRVEARNPVLRGRVIATYSNFHRFVGEGRILPDNAEVETSK